MKLLYVEDYEFQPAEVRYLAQVSGSEVPDVIDRIDRLRATVARARGGVEAHGGRPRRGCRHGCSSTSAACNASTTTSRPCRRPVWRPSGCAKSARNSSARSSAAASSGAKLLAQAQRRKVTAPYKGHRRDAEHQHRQHRITDRAPAARAAHEGWHPGAEPRQRAFDRGPLCPFMDPSRRRRVGGKGVTHIQDVRQGTGTCPDFESLSAMPTESSTRRRPRTSRRTLPTVLVRPLAVRLREASSR